MLFKRGRESETVQVRGGAALQVEGKDYYKSEGGGRLKVFSCLRMPYSPFFDSCIHTPSRVCAPSDKPFLDPTTLRRTSAVSSSKAASVQARSLVGDMQSRLSKEIQEREAEAALYSARLYESEKQMSDW